MRRVRFSNTWHLYPAHSQIPVTSQHDPSISILTAAELIKALGAAVPTTITENIKHIRGIQNLPVILAGRRTPEAPPAPRVVAPSPRVPNAPWCWSAQHISKPLHPQHLTFASTTYVPRQQEIPPNFQHAPNNNPTHFPLLDRMTTEMRCPPRDHPQDHDAPPDASLIKPSEIFHAKSCTMSSAFLPASMLASTNARSLSATSKKHSLPSASRHNIRTKLIHSNDQYYSSALFFINQNMIV